MIFDAYETYSTFLLMGNSFFHGNVKKKKLEWRHQVTIMNHSDSAASLSIVISSEGIWFPDENEKKWSLDFCFYHCQLTMFLIQQTNKNILFHDKNILFTFMYSVHYSSNFTFTILS